MCSCKLLSAIAVFTVIAIGYGNAKSLQAHVIHYKPDLRIINGHEVAPHSAPEVVNMIIQVLNTSSQQYMSLVCGGSLLSQRYVLTAAHCVKDSHGIKVMIGIHNNAVVEPGSYYVDAARAFYHQQYDPVVIKNDIAIVELSQLVPLGPTVRPVKLPSKKDAAKTYVGETAKAFGWGKTSDKTPPSHVLMGVEIPIVSLEECKQRMAQEHIQVPDLDICAGGLSGTCQGDSGGPLFVGDVQVGLTSFGTQLCERDTPSVFTKVGNYLDWIAQYSDAPIS